MLMHYMNTPTLENSRGVASGLGDTLSRTRRINKITFGVNAHMNAPTIAHQVMGRIIQNPNAPMQVNAPGQPGEKTLGVNAAHECTHTKSNIKRFECIQPECSYASEYTRAIRRIQIHTSNINNNIILLGHCA